MDRKQSQFVAPIAVFLMLALSNAARGDVSVEIRPTALNTALGPSSLLYNGASTIPLYAPTSRTSFLTGVSLDLSLDGRFDYVPPIGSTSSLPNSVSLFATATIPGVPTGSTGGQQMTLAQGFGSAVSPLPTLPLVGGTVSYAVGSSLTNATPYQNGYPGAYPVNGLSGGVGLPRIAPGGDALLPAWVATDARTTASLQYTAGVSALGHANQAAPNSATVSGTLTYHEGSLRVIDRQEGTSMRLLLTAQDSKGSAIPIQTAAQAMGFHHFNWLQLIVSALPAPTDYLNRPWAELPEFNSKSPYPFDPLPGGNYGMAVDSARLINGLPAGSTVPSSLLQPVRDDLPFYFDEVYKGANTLTANDPASSLPSSSPEYQALYVRRSDLASNAGYFAPPDQAMGYEFYDAPSGLAYAVFAVAPVGVTESCMSLPAGASCDFQVVGDVHIWMTAATGVTVKLPTWFYNPDLGAGPVAGPADPAQTTTFLGKRSFESFARSAGLDTEQLASLGLRLYGPEALPIPEPPAALLLAVGLLCAGLGSSRLRKSS